MKIYLHKKEEKRLIKNKPIESSFPLPLANFIAQYPWYILIRKSEPTMRVIVEGVATLPIIIATRKRYHNTNQYTLQRLNSAICQCQLPY